MKNVDLIDRERLLKYIDSMSIEDTSNNLVFKTANTILSMFKQVVEAMPRQTADTERHAHWIRNEKLSKSHIDKIYNCSNCQYEAWGEEEKTNYCSNCGCNMIERSNI